LAGPAAKQPAFRALGRGVPFDRPGQVFLRG
jgi:hypothetical protein